jgi:N-acetylglucosaminyldiphosphoundecaprenol N-acetyl-beta-D-mannosaminyltransferase
MSKRIELFGLPVDVLNMQQTLSRIERSIDNNQQIHHVVVNSAKIVNAQKDHALYESIVHCDIINADGQAVVWASKILNKPLPERVAGIDLMQQLVERASQKKYRIFFLGAHENVLKKVVEMFSNQFGPEIIAGYQHGYFTKEEELQVVKEIADSKPHILFVAMTSPKKEIFLNTYKEYIRAPFIMGVGGSFDVVAGIVKRAPKWMQASGLEWLYRVYQEPKRMWKRYLFTNTFFILLLLKELLKSKFLFNNK